MQAANKSLFRGFGSMSEIICDSKVIFAKTPQYQKVSRNATKPHNRKEYAAFGFSHVFFNLQIFTAKLRFSLVRKNMEVKKV